MRILKILGAVVGTVAIAAAVMGSVYLGYLGFWSIQDQKRAAVERIYPHDPELAQQVRGMGNLASAVPGLALFACWIVVLLLLESHKSPAALRADAAVKEQLKAQRLEDFRLSTRRSP